VHKTKPHATKQAACEELGFLMFGENWKNTLGSVEPLERLTNGCQYTKYRTVYGTWTTGTITKEGTIPISTVADKIYDNAKTGDADSVSVVTTAVADLTKEGEYDTPLDLVKPEDK
ncbi:TPA: hypothetical protein MPW60_003107, partial [Listeria monocytogenes]|nr:hypothetical protein [Listeria monocytogenes]